MEKEPEVVDDFGKTVFLTQQSISVMTAGREPAQDPGRQNASAEIGEESPRPTASQEAVCN